MSLLNGLDKALSNPIFDTIMESELDDDLDFEFALEAVVDKQIELSEEDYRAILDDNNPDNEVADLGRKDESIANIAADAIDDDLKSLESMLCDMMDEYALESADDMGIPEEDDEPGAMDSMLDEEEDEVEDENISLDSLLDMIFKQQ